MRTKVSTLEEFDEIVAASNLTRSGVIEGLMESYIEKNRKIVQIPSLKLNSSLGLYRGVASSVSEKVGEDDLRAKHMLGI